MYKNVYISYNSGNDKYFSKFQQELLRIIPAKFWQIFAKILGKFRPIHTIRVQTPKQIKLYGFSHPKIIFIRLNNYTNFTCSPNGIGLRPPSKALQHKMANGPGAQICMVNTEKCTTFDLSKSQYFDMCWFQTSFQRGFQTSIAF